MAKDDRVLTISFAMKAINLFLKHNAVCNTSGGRTTLENKRLYFPSKPKEFFVYSGD